jgi:hypothetical protein
MSNSTISPTVIECFSRNLPNLKETRLRNYRSVAASSTTTAAATPPGVFFCSSPKDLTGFADIILAHKATTDAAGGTRRIASDFRQWSKDSEQDICMAASVYIIEELCEILTIGYPNGWVLSNECTDRKLNKTANQIPAAKTKGKQAASPQKEEESEIENLRYDMVFHAPSTNGEEDKTIAIIEFKKPQQIRYADFKSALLVRNSGKKRASQFANGPLRGNAMSYSKQVSKYAAQQDCRHVALFNWDHLLLYNFTDLNTGQDTAGKTAGLTWVCENKKIEGEHIFYAPIRKVMLGWLLQAFGEHFGKKILSS